MSKPHQESIERRRLLLAATATAATALGVLAAACKRRPPETCPPEPLLEADRELREKLHYTDHSPEPQKFCNGCQQYTHEGDKDCGGCKLMKGPIHPAGYCVAFSARS
jgi:hypothetical protein